MDTWHDMGHMSNLSKLDKGVKKKEKKNHFLGEEGPDFGLVMRVREGEKRQKKKKKSQSFFLRSTKFRHSEFIEPRVKVHLLDEGYAWVPKTWDFAKGSSKKFEKSKVLGLGSAHGTS